MMRGVEMLVFGTMAGGLHLGALSIWSDYAPAGMPGGQGGTASISVQAAPATLAALTQTWETPPDVAQEAQPVSMPVPTPTPVRPTAQQRPAHTAPPPPSLVQAAAPQSLTVLQPAPHALVRLEATLQGRVPLAASAPQAPTPQQMTRLEVPTQSARALTAPRTPQRFTRDTQPIAPSAQAPLAAPRPLARPLAPPEHVATAPSAARPRLISAGTGGTARANSGQNGQIEANALSAGKARSLEAAWGAAIQAKVQRNARASGTGQATVRVRLQVATSGKLVAVRLARGSGNAKADAAALKAVTRARRFKAAPQELSKPLYTFQVTLRFQ